MIRFWILSLAWLAMTACASETFDNPYDPEGSAFVDACAEAPAEAAENCILWFDAKRLDGWHVVESSSTYSVRVRNDDPLHPGVLILPACENTWIEREVPVSGAAAELRVVWQLPADSTAGFELSLNRRPQPLDTVGLVGDDAGWNESTLVIPAGTFRAGDVAQVRLAAAGLLGPDCGSTIAVDRVRMTALAGQ